MMAEKARVFGDTQAARNILDVEDPRAAKALGRKVRGFSDAQWDRVRYAIVRYGNLLKFQQNVVAREYLLSTGDAPLVEASPHDPIWGVGRGADDPVIGTPSKWPGLNLLGYALMEVRDWIRKYPTPTAPSGLLPPWIRYPDVEPSDLFWRMGSGEDYLVEFNRWWNAATAADRIRFHMSYRPTGMWWGWVD